MERSCSRLQYQIKIEIKIGIYSCARGDTSFLPPWNSPSIKEIVYFHPLSSASSTDKPSLPNFLRSFLAINRVFTYFKIDVILVTSERSSPLIISLLLLADVTEKGFLVDFSKYCNKGQLLVDIYRQNENERFVINNPSEIKPSPPDCPFA